MNLKRFLPYVIYYFILIFVSVNILKHIKSYYVYPLLFLLFISPFLIKKARRILKIEKYEREFPDFLRELAYYLEIGFPLPRALKEISRTYKGCLKQEIKKMVYQMSLGFPFTKVLENFARKTESDYIKKAAATLIEVEKFGGDLKKSVLSAAYILQEINNLEKEREVQIKANILTFYGIMILFTITVIILRAVIQKFVTDLYYNPEAFLKEFDDIILATVIINSIFTGFAIGVSLKGSFSRGIIHSLILSLVCLAIYLFGILFYYI